MITNAILLAFQAVLNVILLPITVVDIVIDFIGSIPVVIQFLQVVAYILPWANILPLIVLTIALIIFKICVSLAKLVINFIPFY